MIDPSLLSEKHEGMRMSASGLIRNSAKILAANDEKGLAWSLEEMLKHLSEASETFYAGNPKIIDELLQLYCLDKHRPQ